MQIAVLPHVFVMVVLASLNLCAPAIMGAADGCFIMVKEIHFSNMAMTTKRRYGKESDVYFYQYVQSFKPGEKTTPEEVHRMGAELAEYFKGYKVLIASHFDADQQALIGNTARIKSMIQTYVRQESTELRNYLAQQMKKDNQALCQMFQEQAQNANELEKLDARLHSEAAITKDQMDVHWGGNIGSVFLLLIALGLF